MAEHRAKASDTVRDRIDRAIASFGRSVTAKLQAGSGSTEDHLRAPLERLLEDVAGVLGYSVRLLGETRLPALAVRPDYAVNAAGARVGYIELKRPGYGVPSNWRNPTKHDKEQWAKLSLLPNVLYTDGEHWALYRFGILNENHIAHLHPNLFVASQRLKAPNNQFQQILSAFFGWQPERPRSLDRLVRAVANLCRLLRQDVSEEIIRENTHQTDIPVFTTLANEWRSLLFPRMTDIAFADAYAQTVTFALLLARADGIDFTGRSIGEIALLLGKKHSLIGKALAVLTEQPEDEHSIVIDSMLRVIGAVHWEDFPADSYTYLYEQFAAEYDPALRRQSGIYYTPAPVVGFMTQFVDSILRLRLSRDQGLASDDVLVVDPAMGTGSFLSEVIDTVAGTIADTEGPGNVTPRLRQLANRLVGFESQIAPYAVAELRIHARLRARHRAEIPRKERRFLADTLDDPNEQQIPLGVAYQALAQSRHGANEVKRTEPVVVVLGNPPYRDKAKGVSAWIEARGGDRTQRPNIDAFRAPGNGRHEYVLANLYVYFWRWATWKVFDAHKHSPDGVVAFITTSAYTTGPGFAGMREYLRRTSDEGWIIDLSPEGHQPPVQTRVFSGTQHPICIGVFIRHGLPNPRKPAVVHHAVLQGTQAEKFADLQALKIDGTEWADCYTGWQDPFVPSNETAWPTYPAVGDLLPWHAPGIKPNRTWVYAPDSDTLTRRWDRIVYAPDSEKSTLFKESRDANLARVVAPLAGQPAKARPFGQEADNCPKPVRIGWRSFDRQWLIPDARLLHAPSPDLWRVNSSQQIYTVEQHRHPFKEGPGLVFSSLVPDMDFFNSRGGHVRPLFRDSSGSTPNITPNLITFLSRRLDIKVTPIDLLAYIAGTVAHRGYTKQFQGALRQPGIRVPITASNPEWNEAVAIGREVIWLHTYGERCVSDRAGRRRSTPRTRSNIPKVEVAISDNPDDMPEEIGYDESTQTLHIGQGEIRPVTAAVWNYRIGTTQVVKKWCECRKKDPDGRRSSPLDDINAKIWTPTTTRELLDLLHVLGRCIELEPRQAELLDRIVAGPQITVEELTSAGALPVPESARKRPPRDDMPTLWQGEP